MLGVHRNRGAVVALGLLEIVQPHVPIRIPGGIDRAGAAIDDDLADDIAALARATTPDVIDEFLAA